MFKFIYLLTVAAVVLGDYDSHDDSREWNYVGETDPLAWSYTGSTGPSYWTGTCRTGRAQSPVELPKARRSVLRNAPVSTIALSGFDLDVAGAVPGYLENNAHAAELHLAGPYDVSGGDLPSTYRAAQLHFHWGSNDNQGSEHTIREDRASAEMHIVCYDKARYTSIDNAVAANTPNALAVLSVMIVADKSYGDNSNFAPIVNLLSSITDHDSIAFVKGPFSVRKLMPDQLGFSRYTGSLTTPPCSEIVVWTIFTDPVTISSSQMAKFRTLTHVDTSGQKHAMADNFRPTQRLNGRTVSLYKSKDYIISSGDSSSSSSSSSSEEFYY